MADKTRKSGVIATAQFHEGPLPHPDLLNRYEEKHAGAIQQIFDMARKHQDHVISVEQGTIDIQKMALQNNREISDQVASINRRNQWFAFIVIMSGLGLSAALILQGKETSGLVVILTELCGLAGLFMYHERKSSD